MSNQAIGSVVQVIGPVLDIRFDDGQLPALLNAVTIPRPEGDLTVEVAQHIGDNVVRCIAMSSTDGLVRGAKAIDTGGPITVPVGEECLGRIFNLLGQPVVMPPDQRKKVQHLGGNLAIVKGVLAEVLGFHLGQLVEQLVGQVRGIGVAQQLERVQGGEKAGKLLKQKKKSDSGM